jgi:hypothetical protein
VGFEVAIRVSLPQERKKDLFAYPAELEDGGEATTL